MNQALIMSITTARVKFTQIGDLFTKKHEAIQVTKYGQPYMAIIPWEKYEALKETREILEDPKLVSKLVKGISEAVKDKKMTAAQIRRKLNL